MVERNMIIFEPDVEYGKSTNHTSNEVCGNQHRQLSPKSYKQVKRTSTEKVLKRKILICLRLNIS